MYSAAFWSRDIPDIKGIVVCYSYSRTRQNSCFQLLSPSELFPHVECSLFSLHTVGKLAEAVIVMLCILSVLKSHCYGKKHIRFCQKWYSAHTFSWVCLQSDHSSPLVAMGLLDPKFNPNQYLCLPAYQVLRSN